MKKSLKEDAMRKLLKKFEDIMVAVTFAEANEYDEAIRMVGGQDGQKETAVSVGDFSNQALVERSGK